MTDLVQQLFHSLMTYRGPDLWQFWVESTALFGGMGCSAWRAWKGRSR